jgi:hypothetical protein
MNCNETSICVIVLSSQFYSEMVAIWRATQNKTANSYIIDIAI